MEEKGSFSEAKWTKKIYEGLAVPKEFIGKDLGTITLAEDHLYGLSPLRSIIGDLIYLKILEDARTRIREYYSTQELSHD